MGPEISTKVADSYLKTVQRPLSKESSAKLKANVKIPSNCKNFAPPKINPEIWKIIPSQARLQDIKQQQVQQTLATGLSALAMICNEVISNKQTIPDKIVSSVIKVAMDAANVLGDQTQQLSVTRRLELKRHLNPEYGGICTGKVHKSI